jgi:hypothetical protein
MTCVDTTPKGRCVQAVRRQRLQAERLSHQFKTPLWWSSLENLIRINRPGFLLA